MKTGNYAHAADNPLGNAPLASLIAKYSIPAIISMLIGAAYNITDQIFIGHVVGMLGNAATNVVFPTVTLTVGLSMLFLTVGTLPSASEFIFKEMRIMMIIFQLPPCEN